jgi:hypothetical protein
MNCYRRLKMVLFKVGWEKVAEFTDSNLTEHEKGIRFHMTIPIA